MEPVTDPPLSGLRPNSKLSFYRLLPMQMIANARFGDQSLSAMRRMSGTLFRPARSKASCGQFGPAAPITAPEAPPELLPSIAAIRVAFDAAFAAPVPLFATVPPER